MTGADTGESETDRDYVDREKQGAHSRHKVKRIERNDQHVTEINITSVSSIRLRRNLSRK